VVGDSNWFGGINAFGAALWALRLDALGNVMWQRAFGRSYRQGLAQGAASVSDGVLVLGTGGVIKLDVGGNVIWAKSYTADQPLNLASIAARSDGSFVVAGTVGTSARGFASGLDARGNVLWSRVYGGSGFARVRTTSDGGSILIGQTDSNNGDAYVVKLDAGGNVAWQRAIDNAYDSSGGTIPNPPPLGSSNDSGNDIAEKPGGGYVVVGTGYGAFPMPEPTSLGYYAAFEADLGSDGSLAGTGSQLYRAPSDALYTAGYAVLVRPDGTTLIAGRRANQSSDLGGKEDVLMIQGGTFSSLGGSGNDAILSGALAGNAAPLAATLDGGAILAATTSSFGGQEQFWVVKLNRAGNINFPYRANLSGASYTNEHATSVSLGTQATDLPIAVTSFDSELQSEVTPISSLQQAP
jgi:hypothetical protein